MRHRRGDGFERVRNAPADHVGQSGQAAFVRDMSDLHARQVVEKFGDQMRSRAGARRRERVLAGVRLEECYEFARVLRGKLRRGHQQERRQADVGDRRQLTVDIVGGFLQQRIDRHRAARCRQQRVAVGRGLGRDVGAYHAARASAIVDHDLLAENFRDFLRHHAADEIRGLARRPWHDHAHRPVRIILLRAHGARHGQHGRK